MRRITFIAGIVFALLTSLSHAGFVLFDPPTVAFDPSTPYQTYEFDVYLDSEPGGITTFDASNIVIISTAMTELAFTYSLPFVIAAGQFIVPQFCDPGPCDPHQVYVGGYFGGGPAGMPFPVGTLRARFDLANTDWMNNPPDFAILVDSDLDGGFSSIALGANPAEGLFGGVRLLPEPCSALLTAVGLLALWRRSRRVAPDGR